MRVHKHTELSSRTLMRLALVCSRDVSVLLLAEIEFIIFAARPYIAGSLVDQHENKTKKDLQNRRARECKDAQVTEKSAR